MKSYSLHTRGFTILELVVVIAIIALMSTFLISRFSGVLERSRDDRRLTDISDLRKGLSLYQINHGRFPVTIEPITITRTDAFSTTLLEDGSMKAIPADPLSPTYDYTYQSNALGTTYTLSFCLETDTIRNYTKGCGNVAAP